MTDPHPGKQLSGRADRDPAQFSSWQRVHRQSHPGGWTAAYAVMNEKSLALEWLQETANDGFPCYPWFERDPCLSNLRSDVRFRALVDNLEEQWRSSSLV